MEETGCWDVFWEPSSNLQLDIRQKLWGIPEKALQHHQKYDSRAHSELIAAVFIQLGATSSFFLQCSCAVSVLVSGACFRSQQKEVSCQLCEVKIQVPQDEVALHPAVPQRPGTPLRVCVRRRGRGPSPGTPHPSHL